MLGILLVFNLMGRPKTISVGRAPAERTVQVLVATRSIEAGQPLDIAQIKLEARPVSLLPVDPITSPEQIRNKVAAGPIPAGYPLARAFLADPLPILPVPEDQAKVQAPVDPVDTLLEQIKHDTVAVPVAFASQAPNRGARIAVAITGQNGETVLILDKAWVSESQGNRATLRVDPDRALFIESARKLGNLSFIEIATAGESPYSGHAVNDMDSLELALGVRNVAKTAPVQAKKEEKENVKGYAWVSGSKVRVGVSGDGSMHMVDSKGRKLDKNFSEGLSPDNDYDPEREQVP